MRFWFKKKEEPKKIPLYPLRIPLSPSTNIVLHLDGRIEFEGCTYEQVVQALSHPSLEIYDGYWGKQLVKNYVPATLALIAYKQQEHIKRLETSILVGFKNTPRFLGWEMTLDNQ